jgi:mannose-6-phosphate isomerase-like protein (cupin superfamily)
MKITRREISLMLITAAMMCIPMAMIAHHYQQPDMPSAVYDWNNIPVSKTKTGEKRQFFDGPTKTLDNLECHVSTLNIGEIAHPPHQHPEEELTIVKEGTVEVLVNGELKRCGPGSIIFQASNTLHNIKNVGAGTCTYFALKWRSAKTPAK